MSTAKKMEANMNALSALIPHRVNVTLLAGRKSHGFKFQFKFQVDVLTVYVLSDTTYWAYKPKRGSTVQTSGSVSVMGPNSKRMIKVSNWVDMYYDIPHNAEFHPVGWKYKTSPRYKKLHTTIIPLPFFRGFGSAIERKSGGTQEERITFATPAKLRMQFGIKKFTFQTAFYWINTIDKKKLSDSYSRGSAIGFTTDLINSKDKPTHWGVVINGESRAPIKPKGPVH